MVDENQTDCVFIHDPVENGLQVKNDIVQCFQKQRWKQDLQFPKHTI